MQSTRVGIAAIMVVASLTGTLTGQPRGEAVIFRPAADPEQLPPNRLKDPGFEHVGTSRSDWQPFGKGFDVDQKARSEGQQSIRCTATDRETSLGAGATFVLNHKRIVPIRIALRSKCRDVPDPPSSGYCIYVDLIHTDGTPTWGLVQPFSTGTHDWEQRTLTILPAKPVERMMVYSLFRGVIGTVWFDDARVWIFDDAKVRVFDGEGVALETPPRRTGAAVGQAVFAGTGDGLQLVGDADTGRIAGVRIGGARETTGGFPGGIFVQDVGQHGPIYQLIAPVKTDGAVATQRGTLDSLDLDVTATWRSQSARITGRVELKSRRPAERALSIVVAVPLHAHEWWWHDDVRRRSRIEAGQTYCNASQMRVGKTGNASIYPLAAITSDVSGLAMTVPLDEPRIMRLAYDSEHAWLYAAFDLAISPEPRKLSGRAHVDVELFSFEPRWGFRAALQRYYDLHPAAFTRRVKDVGLWMAFAKISKVERPEDFGFCFKEGLGDQAYDNAHGILTFRYTEPQSQWMPMPKEMPRSYDQVVKLLGQRSREGKPAQRRRYQAVLTSAAMDADGRYHVTTHDAPWCDGGVFALNPDPDLPGDVTKARVNYDPAEAAKLYADDPQHGVDGEYLDSLDGWSYQQNYRRDHHKYVDVPLVYDPQTRRICITNAFSIWEYVRWVAQHVHARGKLMMANYTPTRYPWQVPHLDVMGQEHNWRPAGQWQPMSDAELCYRRALCRTKPYLLLQNSDFKTWTKQHTRWYFMRAGAYGVQPSFFSANASTDQYFANPAWYNRDREVFKQLIPVIRRIGRAGWRPITYARATPTSLQVERFGGRDGTDTFLTVHNPGEKPVSGRLILDKDLQGMHATEAVRQQDLAMESTGQARTIAITVPGRETLFIHLGRK